MEQTVTTKAYAKINLFLYITGVNEKNYHNLYSVMHTIDLYDEITVTKKEDIINLTSDNKEIPLDSKNTVHKAAKLLKDKFGIKHGWDINIKKNIPIGAGLGGPSADAAATLLAINELEGLNIAYEELVELGVKIGADVPFLIKGGIALCEGIGDVILDLNKKLDYYVLLAKPNLSISTEWAYKEFDRLTIDRSFSDIRDENLLTDNLNINIKSNNLYNDLEIPSIKKYSIIEEIKEFLIDNKALSSLMSGSGSTVFGLFDDYELLCECERKLRDSFKDITIINTKLLEVLKDRY